MTPLNIDNYEAFKAENPTPSQLAAAIIASITYHLHHSGKDISHFPKADWLMNKLKEEIK